jgi:4-hydroxyphenylpyruvate dioxygenase
MKPAISQVSTLSAAFERDLEDYAAAHCGAVEIWLGKLERFLESHSLDDVRRLRDEHELVFPVASYQGGLLVTQGAARQEHWAHFERRLSLCRELGIETLVVAADVQEPLDQEMLDRVSISLDQAAQRGANAGVRLALEFQARGSFINNLETAAAVVEQCGRPQLGLCLDVFQFYLGPSKFDDLGLLSPANLFHVQLSDLAGRPRELALDADRVLPGDGDFRLEPLIDALRQMNYSGYVSVELMNPQIWQIPPRQVAEVGVTALRKVLGLAGMN